MPDIKITESADKKAAREAGERRMFGCLIADFKESIEDSLTFKHAGPAMCAMGVMSDAQEEMALGHIEAARQAINRAKWVICEYIHTRG